MRFVWVLAKILVIVLVFRMVAAPISRRPESSRPNANFRYVARICAWPVCERERERLTVVLSDSDDGRASPLDQRSIFSFAFDVHFASRSKVCLTLTPVSGQAVEALQTPVALKRLRC